MDENTALPVRSAGVPPALLALKELALKEEAGETPALPGASASNSFTRRSPSAPNPAKTAAHNPYIMRPALQKGPSGQRHAARPRLESAAAHAAAHRR